MMQIYFEEFTNEIDDLINFLTSNTWEFHGTPNPNPDRIRVSYQNQYYSSDDAKTFWVLSDSGVKIGIIRVFDLEDGNPLFDIRISNAHKGMGIGTSTIKWLVDYIFTNYPEKKRLEGTTRQDNYAMRCVFHKCGFVKEAHYRNGWECSDGSIYDAIGYGVTKEDWQKKQTTPVNWNDFKF